MSIENQPGDFVALVGHQRLLQKGLQGKIGQRHLRRGTLLAALRGNPSQRVT